MESATTWTPSQRCGIQMLTSKRVTDKCHAKGRILPIPQHKFADLGAHRDHGWVHRCWRYSLAVMTGKRAFRRRALWRLHPACREVTCGDTDVDWPRPWAVLHTTGLWGRSYLGVGRRAASRARQSTLLNGRHGFNEGENLPWMIACRESSHTDT